VAAAEGRRAWRSLSVAWLRCQAGGWAAPRNASAAPRVSDQQPAARRPASATMARIWSRQHGAFHLHHCGKSSRMALTCT
jgi:hypothetical protein